MMKKYASKNLSDVVGTAGSMLLFSIFTVCMLVMISAAASTYSRIRVGFEQTFSSASSLRYMSNKLKGADCAELILDGHGVAVTNGGLVCVIYCTDGGIYEKSVSVGAALEATGGYRIFEADGLSINEEGGLYHIEITTDGETNSAFVRKG